MIGDNTAFIEIVSTGQGCTGKSEVANRGPRSAAGSTARKAESVGTGRSGVGGLQIHGSADAAERVKFCDKAMGTGREHEIKSEIGKILDRRRAEGDLSASVHVHVVGPVIADRDVSDGPGEFCCVFVV